MARVHTYRAEVAWSGSTGDGYRGYAREHVVRTPPADEDLTVTADVPFGGREEHLNPEQLLLAAAASCQMLSFLAEAALAGVDVRSYADDASAEMPVTRGPMKIAAIVLRPRIVVAEGTDLAEVERLVEKGHEGCFIANTLDTEMLIEPTVVWG